MLSFKNLTDDIKKNDKAEEYLLNFFCKENYKEYYIDPNIDKNQNKAIKIMFESKKDLKNRINDAFNYDPFCIEAFFSYMFLSEDIYVQLRFNAYYNEIDSFPEFDNYQKKCYLTILRLYVDFLLDINNVTKAIKIQKLINQFSEINSQDVSKLAYMYCSIENDADFYRLYLDNKFELSDYLLLLVTLLKHEEEVKAREVLMDMFDNIAYGTYLDHVWDLNENDPEQKQFMTEVDECYDEIMSIPTFFSWVNKTREKYGK